MTSTSSHPPPDAPDASQGTSSRQPSAPTTAAAKLADSKIRLKAALRQFPDFPSPGILFEDISPLFSNPKNHALLLDTLVDFISEANGGPGRPDIIVGLDARGFYFGPSLALRFECGFVPARKRGKLPGETVEASFTKEYGQDILEMQADAIKPGQKVLIVDDIIATGKCAHITCYLEWILILTTE
jgi:adenine phosphoribosyltransferase